MVLCGCVVDGDVVVGPGVVVDIIVTV